jgi:hypothetical protein
MSNDFIGKASYGKTGGRQNWTNSNWKVEEGKDNVYQLLPPFGLLAASGKWFYYDSGHWGYKLSNGKQRSFRCIQRKNRKSGMVESECPECSKITENRTLLESKVRDWNSEKRGRDEIRELSQPINAWLFSHNNSKGFWLNARRPDGQIGRLFLKITAKQSLDIVLQNLRSKEGISDPIAEGVWFNFKKIKGDNKRFLFPVEVVMTDVNVDGQRFKKMRMDPITEDVVTRMKDEAFELSTGYKDLSYDEIKRLVDSGGDPAIVDGVFGVPTVTDSSTTTDFVPEEDETPTSPDSYVDAETALMKQLEEVRNRKGSSQAAKPPTVDEFTRIFGQAGK